VLRRVCEKAFEHVHTIFDTESSGRLILFSPVVGVFIGLGTAAFFFCVHGAQEWILGVGMGYIPPAAGSQVAETAPQMPTHWYWVLLIPTLGGLACGWLVYGYAPEAEGHGTDAMVRAFHRQGGKIRARTPLVKAVASVLTISTGGSAGHEGPIAQIGAGFGSVLADKLKLSERERRLLMLAGGAGGIGAIFRAPLGGALFVAEVLYSTAAVEFEAVVPAAIASITAFVVFTGIYGSGHVFTVPDSVSLDTQLNLAELPFYAGLAILCALTAAFYVTSFYGLRDKFFAKLPIPSMYKTAIGGFLLGVLALFFPQIMGGGYGWVQLALDNQMPIRLMIMLGLAKVLATSFTISSGGSGGVFAPSLFIGAMLGGAYGYACNQFFPGIVTQPEAYVLVGMGAFFAGVAKVPLTAMLMVCEMSGSYGLLPPMMLVSILNVAFLSRRWTLYEEQVPGMVDSPAHMGDFIVDVLEQIRVKEVMQTDRPIDFVPEATPLPQILRLASHSQNTYFPVVDAERKLVGIFSLRDLRGAMTDETAGALVVATDLATQNVFTVKPDDDLHTAMRWFTRENIDEIPVVDPDDARQIIAMLSRKNVIAAYNEQMAALHEQHQRSS